MSTNTVIGNILLSFVQQLLKPSPSVAQALFAIVSMLLSLRFIGDTSITYPNATPLLTEQSKIHI